GEVHFATSETYAGGVLSDLYPDAPALPLVSVENAPLEGIDVAFCCLPHTASMPWVQRLRRAGVLTIDLSADFRLDSAAVYERWYKVEHTATELLPEAVYGLVELNRAAIREAKLVANPGCYPTGVLLALAPILREGLLAEPQVIVDAKSGASGAGRSLSLTTHFVEVNENFSPYKIGYAHRHISEMEQEAEKLAGGPVHFTFAPHLLPMSRGILSTIYVRTAEILSAEEWVALYREAYAEGPFVRVLAAGQLATLRHVIRTNLCVISLTPVEDTNTLVIVSAVDNLIKGASGQAVQNMNLMLGLDERLGLQ
ncbi:MAG: N-acetyl-gamma-glutamyl-phosphate reductase, partial [Chloroflexota bacterium]|nr:N-acetyl-gamma-glutamyl-phosphate reductase [Chloroflexota bacterium]